MNLWSQKGEGVKIKYIRAFNDEAEVSRVASEIKDLVADLTDKRESKQPLEYPSAGSTFKRPEGYFVGKIMDDLGLKGYTIGGAQVSEKHGGFIINTGNATAKDVKDLIEYVVNKVKKEYNIELEPEVKMI